MKQYPEESLQEPMDTLYEMMKPLTGNWKLCRPFLTETLHPMDPRSDKPEFIEAKKREVKGLIDRGKWKVVLKEEVPKYSNILNGRFVLTIKNANTDHEIYKARYVVQGHRDKDKDFIVHESKTLRQSSKKLILALAAIFGFRVWTHDVKQAYLQSFQNLMRRVYLKPSKEFELSSDQLVQLLKPLYGLADSGDYWNRTMNLHLQDDLGMKSTTGDISLFVKSVHGRLTGLVGTYVDDSLAAGNEYFEKLTSKTMEKFESREREVDNTSFIGMSIKTTKDGFELSQDSYAKSWTPSPRIALFGISLHQDLNWHGSPTLGQNYAVMSAWQLK